LIEQLVSRAQRDGALLASLFSEIGTAFYERLGFTEVPLDEVTVTVDRKKGGAPAMLVRAGEERDLGAVAAMHAVRSASAPFALQRDGSLVHYALSKRRLLAGLGPLGLRQLEFFVAEEGASAVCLRRLERERERVDARGGRRPRSGGRSSRRDAAGVARQGAEPSHAADPHVVAADIHRSAADSADKSLSAERCVHGEAAGRRVDASHIR
jgi:hypothetical protein